MAGDLELMGSAVDDEVVDGVVVREARPLPAVRPARVVVAQAAAVAATSFVAGAATLAVVHRRRGRKPLRPVVRRGRSAPALEVVASRSFLIDVHQLGQIR